MKVNELFYSIQGEGKFAGYPMVFVRLYGCNLLCPWCDTKYASTSGKFADIDVKEIESDIQSYMPPIDRLYPGLYLKKPWVCITGGEPLMQGEELWELCSRLSTVYDIEIETNGTIVPEDCYPGVRSWCIDVKCPSAKPQIPFNKRWFGLAKRDDQFKFVVEDRQDLGFVSDMLENNRNIISRVYISPVLAPDLDDKISPASMIWVRDVAEFCKANMLPMSLQIHKVIWGVNRRGV